MIYLTVYDIIYHIACIPGYITHHSDIPKNTRDIDMTKKYQL